MSDINNLEGIPEGNFPFNLTLIRKYQCTEPSLMAKYEDGTYHKGYFRGGSNIYLNLITFEDKTVIP